MSENRKDAESLSQDLEGVEVTELHDEDLEDVAGGVFKEDAIGDNNCGCGDDNCGCI